MALHMTLIEDEDPPIKEFSIQNNFLFTKSQRIKLSNKTLDPMPCGCDHSKRFEPKIVRLLSSGLMIEQNHGIFTVL